MLEGPMTFYVARGAADSCGPGCDRWIAVEGKIDSGAAPRFRKFLQRIKDRSLPMYFSSPGGNLDQAVAMGAMLREKPVTARVARTVVGECGFEAQDSDVCLKLKQSGRELHGELWTRGAMCNSACPYLILGAATREIAPNAVLGIHSPKVLVYFRGGIPTQQMRAAATERGHARVDRMVSDYIARMGAERGMLALASTIKFEDVHVLTREEIARFGIDRRERVETPWTFENNGRSVVLKVAAQKNDDGKSYRILQWRLRCFNTEQFEVDFQRPKIANALFAAVSIAGAAPKPLYFTSVLAGLPGSDTWGLRLSRASVRSLAEAPLFDFAETSQGPDGRRLAHTQKFSSEGLAHALDTLLATCPPAKTVTPLQTSIAPLQTTESRDSAAK
jgi:hypothetical protein